MTFLGCYEPVEFSQLIDVFSLFCDQVDLFFKHRRTRSSSSLYVDAMKLADGFKFFSAFLGWSPLLKIIALLSV